MNQPRKHHYLPQFYLRGFSSEGKSVCQIEKISCRSYLCSIRDTAAIRDYHELDHSGVQDPHALEKHLAEIEQHLSEALNQVLQSGINSIEVNARIIEFVSLMRCRVPAFKAFIEESLRQTVRSSGILMERKGALPPVPDGFENILRMDRVKISISNWKILEHMFSLATDLDMLRLLLAMTPSILRAPEDMAFFTCDQPVAIYHPGASVNDPYGKGLTDPDIEISLPLSSRVLLHLSWNKDAPKERILDAAEVNEFNRRTVVMADSLLFAENAADAVINFIARYNKCSAGVELQVLDTGDQHFHIIKFRPVMNVEQYDS